MVFKKSIKGQAAIEFLMTYGWMLLVVLIVGALIFSFVDFGALLPNKLDLSNNLRGDPTGSVAYASSTVTAESNQVMVVFRYNGAKRAIISPAGSMIKTELGETCYGAKLTNLNTNAQVNVSDLDVGNSAYTFDPVATTDTPFLNGHDGLMIFDCNSNTDIITYTNDISPPHGVAGGLLGGDTVVGTISIPVKDPKTKLNIPSTGSIRLTITG